MSDVPAPRASSDALARALGALAEDGWTVLHPLRWPGRLPTTVSHAVVGRAGVLVLDVRPWSGAVVDRGVLRVGRRTRDRECLAAAQAGAAVASLVHAEHRDAVRAVVCLTASRVPVSAVASGALVVAATDLRGWAAGLPARLDDDEVQLLSTHLGWQLSDAVDAAGGPATHAGASPDGAALATVTSVTTTVTTATTATTATRTSAPLVTDVDSHEAGVAGEPGVDQTGEGLAVVVPLTRRARREAERVADQRTRRSGWSAVAGLSPRGRRGRAAARR